MSLDISLLQGPMEGGWFIRARYPCTGPSTLERGRARAHRIGEAKLAETDPESVSNNVFGVDD